MIVLMVEDVDCDLADFFVNIAVVAKHVRSITDGAWRDTGDLHSAAEKCVGGYDKEVQREHLGLSSCCLQLVCKRVKVEEVEGFWYAQCKWERKWR